MYQVVFIDAIHVKIRDGQVTNRPVYVAIGVTCGGERDVLGLWAGDGGEGAKFWLAVLTEIKNRGAGDVCIVVCDGLKGLPDAITTVWDRAIVQTCVIHLLRNTFRYASRKYWDQIAKEIRPVYTAPTEAAAKERFVEFTAHWGAQYPAIIRLWETPGASSCPSWTRTSRSDASSAAPTPSNPSMPATGAQSAPAGTSPPSRPR